MTTGLLLLWMATHFVAVVLGAVMLIQVGGWLPILTAILIILFYFISGVVNMLSAAMMSSYKKQLEDFKKMEGMLK